MHVAVNYINGDTSAIDYIPDSFKIYKKQPSMENNNGKPVYRSQDLTMILFFTNCGHWVIGQSFMDRYILMYYLQHILNLLHDPEMVFLQQFCVKFKLT